jgi:protein ImuA
MGDRVRRSFIQLCEPAVTKPSAQLPADFASLPDGDERGRLIADLKSSIVKIERRQRLAAPHVSDSPVEQVAAQDKRWQLGVAEIDRLLPLGLAENGVHEIKPAEPGGHGGAAAVMVSAMMFAVGLLLRRSCAPPARVLWCVPSASAGELGRAYGPGLAAAGLDPCRLLLAEPARHADALWVIEEALKSQSLAAVVACLGSGSTAAQKGTGGPDFLGLTASRRLALAAAAGATPCLLITDPRAAPVAAVASRWRVAPAPSAPHPFDVRAPGSRRFAILLERCRSAPLAAGAVEQIVEWCDDTHCFRLAAALADRADAPRRADGPDTPVLRRLPVRSRRAG